MCLSNSTQLITTAGYDYDADEFAARSGGDAAEWQAAKAVAEDEALVAMPGEGEMATAEVPNLDPMQYPAVMISSVEFENKTRNIFFKTKSRNADK